MITESQLCRELVDELEHVARMLDLDLGSKHFGGTMRLLAKHGRFRITEDDGEIVRGVWL